MNKSVSKKKITKVMWFHEPHTSPKISSTTLSTWGQTR